MIITIYQYNTGLVRAVVDPDDKSQQSCGIMREDSVTLSFSSPVFIDFQIGDYCTVYGSKYRLNREAEYTKTGTRNFAYSLTLEGSYNQLSRAQYLTLNAFNNFTEGKFSLTGRPVDFMNLIISNMNRVFPNDNWQLGQCIDGLYTTIDFNSQNCLQVLSTLATNYNTEFLVNGNTISLIQTQVSSGVTLEYGKGKALYSIGKKNTDNTTSIITRLYVYGSDKNIGSNYRNGAPRLRLADKLYIERNVDIYGVYEATVVFDGSAPNLPEIYPHRTGTVTAVGDINVFFDAAIDFDVNAYELPGVTPQVTFNTGLLAGITFDIHGYDPVGKQFTLNYNTSSQTITLPTAAIKPAVGDEYVIINITQPLAYITDAEAQLLQQGQAWLNLYGPSRLTFTVACNPLYFKNQGLVIALGKSYLLKSADAKLNRQIRVMAFTRSLRKPELYNSLTLADTVVPQLPIVKLINSL